MPDRLAVTYPFVSNSSNILIHTSQAPIQGNCLFFPSHSFVPPWIILTVSMPFFFDSLTTLCLRSQCRPFKLKISRLEYGSCPPREVIRCLKGEEMTLRWVAAEGPRTGTGVDVFANVGVHTVIRVFCLTVLCDLGQSLCIRYEKGHGYLGHPSRNGECSSNKGRTP